MNKIKIASEKGYFVTKEGDVYFNSRKRVLNACNYGGVKYYSFNIKINGKSTRIKVHRLQAYQKYGDEIFNDEIVVRHLDGNSLNNSYDNIAIGTNHDNRMDIPEEIRRKIAINASNYTKIYNHEEIYEYYCKSKSFTKTMKEFNIKSKNSLYLIIKKYNNKKHLTV